MADPATDLNAVGRIAEDGHPITVADLTARLTGAPPDAPVVLGLDGPDSYEASPLDWTDVLGYRPANGGHGTVSDWDLEDEPDAEEPDPGVVKVFVLGPRGLRDEYRCAHCGGSGVSEPDPALAEAAPRG